MRKDARISLNLFLLLVFLLFPVVAESQVKYVSLASGGVGGVFYPIGGAMANVITKYIPGYRATSEATAGSSENARLLESGKADVALLGAVTAYNAYKGVKPFSKPIELRVVLSVFDTQLQTVVLKKSGIKSYSDLKGKRIAVGPSGSGMEVINKAVLASIGLTYNDFTPIFFGRAEGSDALKDGIVSANMVWGVGAAAVQDVATTHDIDILPLSSAEMDMVIKANPYFTEYTLPAKSIRGIDKDVRTVSEPSILAAYVKADEVFIYNVTKAILEHTDDIIKVHAYGKEITLQNAAKNIGISYHSGAIKYFKEKGAWKQ